jgi:hypothetical protein
MLLVSVFEVYKRSFLWTEHNSPGSPRTWMPCARKQDTVSAVVRATEWQILLMMTASLTCT